MLKGNEEGLSHHLGIITYYMLCTNVDLLLQPVIRVAASGKPARGKHRLLVLAAAEKLGVVNVCARGGLMVRPGLCRPELVCSPCSLSIYIYLPLLVHICVHLQG